MTLPVRPRDRPLRHAAPDRRRRRTSSGSRDDEIELYGPTKAKVTLEAIARLEAERPRGKYVVVTAITPTPLGEGKTTTTVGLAQGLNRIGKRAAVTIRQPSLGPVFGIKGGAAGGGYSQVIPMEDFNLHLTGDVHAIGAAHNLAAAFIDNHLHHGNPLGIDPHGDPLAARPGHQRPRAAPRRHRPRRPRERRPARDRVRHHRRLRGDGDPRARHGPPGPAGAPRPDRPRDARATARRSPPRTSRSPGAMTVLLRDALKPNLLQTLEGGPAFVHCRARSRTSPTATTRSSPTGSRSRPTTSSCTEAGFGADMGAEKFFDIKCRASGLTPDAAVVVATVRALKMHGGVGRIVAGKPLDPALLEENPEAVRRGAANLAKQIENVTHLRRAGGRRDQRVPDRHAGRGRGDPRGRAGGRRPRRGRRHATSPTAAPGAEDLARGGLGRGRGGRAGLPAPLPRRDAARATRSRRSPRGSTAATASTTCRPPRKQLKQYEDLGFGHLPICMAKTQYSLSHDAALKGRPTGFRSRSARSGCRPAPGSSPRSAARCGRCRACRRGRAARASTSTPTGTSSGCSSLGRQTRPSGRVSRAAEDRRDDAVRRDHPDASIALVGDVDAVPVDDRALGPSSVASVAGPPSPAAPASPVPANVVMTRSGRSASWSRVGRRVGDVEVACRIDRQSLRVSKVAVLPVRRRRSYRPRRYPRIVVIALRVDSADPAVVRVRDVDRAVRRDGDAGGVVDRSGHRRPAVAPEAVGPIAGDRRQDPLRIDLPNPIVVAIGDVQVAPRVERELRRLLRNAAVAGPPSPPYGPGWCRPGHCPRSSGCPVPSTRRIRLLP